MFAELTEKSMEEIDKGLDQVFRLRSKFIKRENTTQDVMVIVLSKKLKNKILRQSYLNPIESNGKRVLILRELPRQVILQRKGFKILPDKLKAKNMRFRWELPSGLNLMFKGERKIITTEAQLNEFLTENMK